MSDQAQGGTSETVHWNQTFEETVFDNISGRNFRTVFSPIGPMNNVPRLCENVDVYNGYNQRFTTSTSGRSLLPSSAGDNVGLQSDDVIESNPIGSLQELCIARHIPFPVYTFSDESLKKHNTGITAMCTISIYNFSGTARTKQAAKKKAAYLMYKQIEKLTSKDLHQIIGNEVKHINETCNKKFFLCHESVTLLKTFFGLIDAPKTPHLQNIKKNSFEFKLTAAETLKIISEKENFTFNYDIISQNSDEVEILMQVNTDPVIVVSKSGKNVSDAQESASRVVLTYLKLKFNI